MRHSQIAYQTGQFSNSLESCRIFEKKFLDSIFGFQNDKMAVFSPNEMVAFTLYETFSNRIPNWTTFVKEFFVSVLSLKSLENCTAFQND